VDHSQAVVVAVYVVPSAARAVKAAHGLENSISPPEFNGVLLGKILARAAARTAVLAMGNPYLTEDFPAIQNYICAFSNATVSEISAAKALFGEIPIHGHLPVNIPNVAIRGAENQRPAQVANGGSPGWNSRDASRLISPSLSPWQHAPVPPTPPPTLFKAQFTNATQNP
jgi:hypothetical protein